jgi:DNA-binding CsgD family transcriptional regulator
MLGMVVWALIMAIVMLTISVVLFAISAIVVSPLHAAISIVVGWFVIGSFPAWWPWLRGTVRTQSASEERVQRHYNLIALQEQRLRHVAWMKDAGYSNADIAKRMGISENTVREIVRANAL